MYDEADDLMSDIQMEQEVEIIFNDIKDIFIEQLRTCSRDEIDQFKRQLGDKDQRDRLLSDITKEAASIGNSTSKSLTDLLDD